MRLMIVDDNKMFRLAMNTMIDWEKHGFSLMLQAINGVHALELLQEETVDIVITDMSMPEMNGIELIQVLRDDYPSIKIIALSNYDDFDFVKSALKMGATDYLLKHEITAATLLSALEGCRHTKENSKNIRQQVDSQQKYLEIDSFVGKLFHGQLGYEEMQIGLNSYSNSHNTYGDLVVLSIQQQEGEWKDYSFREWLHGMINRNEVLLVATMHRNSHIIIVNYYQDRGKNKIRNKLGNLTNDILYEAKAAGFSIRIIASDLGIGLKSLRGLYEQIMVVKDHTIYSRPKEITYYTCGMKSLETISEPSIIIGERIYQDDLQKSKSMFVGEIEGIFERLRNAPIDYESVEKVMFELATIIPHMAKAIGANFFDVVDSQSNLYQMLEQKTYLDDKEVLFLQVVNELYETSSGHSDVDNSDVGRIMTYIEKNYQEELTLTSIAKKYRYSPNYLSTLFKQNAGATLIEYVKEVRVGHAKVFILERCYKTYEIAEMTGFKNTSYFCTVFKELTGMSPKEYRDSNH